MTAALLTRPVARPRTSLYGPVETFAVCTVPGNEPGEVWTYSDPDLAEIEENFKLLSTGPEPLHRVPVVMTHDKVFAHAWVERAKKAGDVLHTFWDDRSPELIEATDRRQLRKVSAEIKEDFRAPDGRVYPGKYLYRVAVLGADPPRIKGLADLPQSRTFADRGPPGRVVTRNFSDPRPTMDVNQAVAILQGAGKQLPEGDPNTWPPEVQNIVIAWALDVQGGGADAAGASAGAVPAAAFKDPAKLFADPAVQNVLWRVINDKAGGLLERIERREKESATKIVAERQDRVRKFMDDMREANKVSGAENDASYEKSLRNTLVAMAGEVEQPVRKFSDGSSQPLLDIMMDDIRNRQPRYYGERVTAKFADPAEAAKADRLSIEALDARTRSFSDGAGGGRPFAAPQRGRNVRDN